MENNNWTRNKHEGVRLCTMTTLHIFIFFFTVSGNNKKTDDIFNCTNFYSINTDNFFSGCRLQTKSTSLSVPDFRTYACKSIKMMSIIIETPSQAQRQLLWIIFPLFFFFETTWFHSSISMSKKVTNDKSHKCTSNGPWQPAYDIQKAERCILIALHPTLLFTFRFGTFKWKPTKTNMKKDSKEKGNGLLVCGKNKRILHSTK